MNGVNVRPYRSGDETGIVELLTDTFDGWPQEDVNCSSVDYWRWKYLDNPVHDSLISVGEHEGRIIGCHHSILLNIVYMGKAILGMTSVDFSVHRDYRSHGLSSRISAPNDKGGEEKGVNFSYFITSNPRLIKSFTMSKNLESRRPRFPRNMRNMVLIKDINTQLQRMPMDNPWMIKLGWNTLNTLNKIPNLFKSDIRRLDSFHVKRVKRFDESINQFWGRIKDNYDFIVERRMEYLNWRYCDPRLSGYNINVAYDESEEILGYIVYKVNRYQEGYPIGYIVDLVSLDKRSDVQYELIETADIHFRENAVNVVNYQLIEGNPQQNMFSRFGFLDSRINIHLFYYQYGEFSGLDELSQVDPSRIHISWGDHDALPVKIPTVR